MADPPIPPRRRRGPPAHTRGAKFSADAAALQEKRVQALNLRKAGATYAQIGLQLGVATMSAHRYVNDAIAEIPHDAAVAVKALALAKLDAQEMRMNGLLREVKDGTRVLERCRIELVLVRIADRRAKLEGTDAPARTELTGKDGGAIMTGHIDLEGLTDEQLERFKRDPAAFVGGGMGSRSDPGAEEETSEEAGSPRRTH
jgi:hypothetical protein